jgi:hypothetical protein
MILTAHQPAYLPWLGLFHKIVLADRFVLSNQLLHGGRDWTARNQILTSSGPLWLSVPCKKTGRSGERICEIEIDNRFPWRRKHWNMMRLNYAKARYFKRYADFFEQTYAAEWASLDQLTTHMLRWFLAELGIHMTIERGSDFDFQGQKTNLIIDMCRKLGAGMFIFGALGRDYADVAALEAANIKAVFQEYVHPVYPQQHPGFTSHLSIVDLLFNCGPDSLEILMRGNLSRADLRAA